MRGITLAHLLPALDPALALGRALELRRPLLLPPLSVLLPLLSTITVTRAEPTKLLLQRSTIIAPQMVVMPKADQDVESPTSEEMLLQPQSRPVLPATNLGRDENLNLALAPDQDPRPDRQRERVTSSETPPWQLVPPVLLFTKSTSATAERNRVQHRLVAVPTLTANVADLVLVQEPADSPKRPASALWQMLLTKDKRTQNPDLAQDPALVFPLLIGKERKVIMVEKSSQEQAWPPQVSPPNGSSISVENGLDPVLEEETLSIRLTTPLMILVPSADIPVIRRRLLPQVWQLQLLLQRLLTITRKLRNDQRQTAPQPERTSVFKALQRHPPWKVLQTTDLT